MEKIKELKTGDIIAFKTKTIWYNPLTWLAPIIRKIAKIDYNHVGVIVELYGKKFVFEAVENGFLPTSFKDKIKDKKIKDFVILRPQYEFDVKKFKTEAINLLGNRYDYRGLLLNQLILNLFGIWIGRKNNQQNKLYCYEAIFYLHRKIFPEWWQMKPKLLFKNPNFKIFRYGA